MDVVNFLLGTWEPAEPCKLLVPSTCCYNEAFLVGFAVIDSKIAFWLFLQPIFITDKSGKKKEFHLNILTMI